MLFIPNVKIYICVFMCICYSDKMFSIVHSIVRFLFKICISHTNYDLCNKIAKYRFLIGWHI